MKGLTFDIPIVPPMIAWIIRIPLLAVFFIILFDSIIIPVASLSLKALDIAVPW